jgi:chromosome segregation ATPase
MSTAKDLETALDAFRHYLQGTQQSLDTLNDASGAHDQRLGELMSTLDALRQDVQVAQAATATLETTLRSASSAAREQQDAQARQWADLDTRFQAQGDELRQRLDMLSERQDQAQIQQDTLQGALAALNDRVGSNEQRLTAHSEQFSKFENVLREVHGEVMTLHQRLQALEDATRNPAFEEQAQRLAALDQRDQERQQALAALQQSLAEQAAREAAPARAHSRRLRAPQPGGGRICSYATSTSSSPSM